MPLIRLFIEMSMGGGGAVSTPIQIDKLHKDCSMHVERAYMHCYNTAHTRSYYMSVTFS
jgi:hypothetical protein